MESDCLNDVLCGWKGFPMGKKELLWLLGLLVMFILVGSTVGFGFVGDFLYRVF
ncbi:hypothetical protein KSC_077020 [Ktedonobacter sp. SOSP1-52]|nr:hypothetical protein KSC_077020 [Ktedonobacter sp. SOSP1-52]